MIISASRRTDIPGFYFDWFLSRLKQGYVLMPNPRNPDRLGRAELSPGNVDCIVFWTKNPGQMLEKISALDELNCRYYTQFTLTPYGREIESRLPPKTELLEIFQRLSNRTGKNRVIWRYDPVFVDGHHSLKWHKQQFSFMCGKLQGFTQRCIISFIDSYKNTVNRYREMTHEEKLYIAREFSAIAQSCGISMYTCSEKIDLSMYGIGHSACIDKSLIEEIIGCSIEAKKDMNQRKACGCIESVDIGAYDTCTHGCSYCYAVSSGKTAAGNVSAHRIEAPMITGYPRGDEIITDRTTASQKINQISFY